MFQLTTLTELGGQRIHRGLAKLPVSISGTEVTTSLFAIVLFAEHAHRRPNEQDVGIVDYGVPLQTASDS
jgi:hypothetical protein